MSVTVIIKDRTLKNIIKNAEKNTDDIVGELAYMTEGHIDENWSTQSPSQPGERPGIDTGTLKNAKQVRKVKWGVWVLEYSTDYAPHLEYGTENEDGSVRMEARPFLLPSVEIITQEAGRTGVLTKIVKG